MPTAQPTSADKTGLVIQGVGKKVRRRTILQGVDCTVARGEVVGILGPNGAGKTTCFQSIVGLIEVTAGHIYIDGTDVTHWPMYRRARAGLGYLPQEASIFRGLTVQENIKAILEVVEPSAAQVQERLGTLLTEFGLTKLKNSPAMALSGGERRRVEIARALAARPAFMLLDEPFAGVDPIAVADIKALVTDLTKRNIGVLITDHNVRETLTLVNRAYILHDGRVLASGTPAEIVANKEVKRVYLGADFKLS